METSRDTEGRREVDLMTTNMHAKCVRRRDGGCMRDPGLRKLARICNQQSKTQKGDNKQGPRAPLCSASRGYLEWEGYMSKREH